jgi:hypothetical protein
LEAELERAASVFDEYAEMHRAKTLGALSIPERRAVDGKVRRNKEHAEHIRATLKGGAS